MTSKRIHIVGRKNSGKTTLIVDLVRELTARGLRVATVKHTHHHHELDTPGKDSHQHREAGAVKVAIIAPGMTAVFEPQSKDLPSEDRLAEVCRQFANCDLVLVEGGLQCAGVKLEVWREQVTDAPMAIENRSITAVITNDQPLCDQPILPRGNVPLVADQVLKLSADETP